MTEKMAEKFGEIHQVDERQLQLLMKDWRRGRATKTLLQAISDAYVAIFALLVVGAMIISAIVQAQTAVAGCNSPSCVAGRGLVPWAALAGALAFTLAASLIFGPVLASTAEGFWLMDAPL
ncbi:MAG: ABC transporter permease, partial [Propionibacterium sp.]